MRKLILSLCIFYVFLNLSLKPSLSKAQAYSCDYIFKNLIQNHDLNGTPGNSNEFATGCVPYWKMMQTLNQGPNTPQLVGTAGINTYSQQWSGWLPYNSSGLLICVEEEIGQKIQTEQNHRYYIGFKARRINLGAGQGYIAAKLWDSSSHQYQVAIYSQLNNSGWTTFSTCVNPFRNFNYLTIYPAGFNSSYRYLWNTGSTNHSINVTSSGKYWVKVIASDSCFAFDTINIVINPKFKMNPTDTIICLNSFPIRISVDSGYIHYSWSNGDTLHSSILVNSPGKYWVKVTDSFGCFRTDTSTINSIQSPFPYLGKDKYLCQGDSVILCDSNLIISYLFHYQWYRNNSILVGDSNRCLTVSDSGQYVLKAWTNDFCIGYDTVNVFVRIRPQITCNININTFCPNDPPEILNCNPPGGVYSGPGITQINNNWYFDPKNVFGTVNISYTLSTPDTPFCTSTTIISMHVDSLRAIIEPIDPLCINDQPVTLTGEPAGGNWNPSNIINPSMLGAGFFPFIYTYTSPSGCITSDTFTAIIIDTFKVNIRVSDYANNCNNSELTAIVTKTGLPTLHYLWSTGDTTQNLLARHSGWYKVSVSTISTKCAAIDSVDVVSPCDSTTKAAFESGDGKGVISGGGTTIWNNADTISDEDIIIEPNNKLIINNSKIFMRNCTKIIVQRKAKLEIYNSCIGGCNWQGIEVWGWWDACSFDTIDNQGKLYANNMTLTGANIGIFAGRRDSVFPCPEYAGGIVQVDNSHFKNNYVDILFSEWIFAEICDCKIVPPPLPPPGVQPGIYWQSFIENSLFDTLSNFPRDNLSHCDTFVDSIITYYNKYGIQNSGNGLCGSMTYFNTTDVLPLYRWHIIDLSPYPDVIFGCPRYRSLCIYPPAPRIGCSRSAWTSGYYFLNDSPLFSNPTITKNNIYINNFPISTPASNYR